MALCDCHFNVGYKFSDFNKWLWLKKVTLDVASGVSYILDTSTFMRGHIQYLLPTVTVLMIFNALVKCHVFWETFNIVLV